MKEGTIHARKRSGVCKRYRLLLLHMEIDCWHEFSINRFGRSLRKPSRAILIFSPLFVIISSNLSMTSPHTMQQLDCLSILHYPHSAILFQTYRLKMALMPSLPFSGNVAFSSTWFLRLDVAIRQQIANAISSHESRDTRATSI